MADEITRTPIYQQVAARLAQEIANGTYEPGSLLPSETQLMERYSVSRPTARAAIAELRQLGLVESQHGKGTFVRRATEPTVTLDQSITRTGKTFHAYDRQFQETEAPHGTRIHTKGTTSTLLQEPDGVPAFAIDRILTDPTTGLRALHRAVIPFDTAQEIPDLQAHPEAGPTTIYAQLSTAGHTLHWTDDIRARIPTPDDRATLHAPTSSCLLVVHRITHGADRPLMLETLTIDADQAHLTYPHTAARAQPRRA
ncbi:GntR family transcriptional regulator [Streptomyces sp. NBC_00448]|uniref:GntR family transcriptional regulator n=1 Tax=Streptomyces sp. NBC_00448 TaxID=2903652 RepID=UPI002E1C631C